MNREADELVDLPVPSPNTAVKDNDKRFDLSILLNQDDLDVRQAAEANPYMTVREYGDLLSRFVGLAPNLSIIIRKFARQDFNLVKKDYKEMDIMLHLLTGMKCEKFAVDFHFLKNACKKKSNWALAAAHAEQITDSFDAFCARIREAKTVEAPQAALYEDSLLQEYIFKTDRDRKLVILAVDDAPDILKAIYSVLKAEYKVIPLSDPAQLESTLAHITPDLFLLDYRMPEITGLDLIPVIRNHQAHKETPIVFLTSEGTIDNKTAVVMLGACDFLVKPIKADTLRDIIKRHIKKAQP